MGNLYNRIHSLVLDKGMTDGSACAAVGLPRSTLGSLKTGKTKSLSQKNLKLFAELLNVTVDKLVNSEDSVADVAAFDGFAGESSDEIKNQVEALYVYRTLTPEEIELIKNYRKATQKEKNIILTLLDKSE